MSSSSPPPSFLSRRSLALRWGISVPTVKRREKQSDFPSAIRVSPRSIRFRMCDVLEYEEKHGIK